jgi:hypothetical protein
MPEESSADDLAHLVRLLLDLGHRGDWDAAMAFFAPDATWISNGFGFEDVEGATAIRDFWIEWYAPYEDVRIETLDVVDLGRGIVVATIHQSGRPGAVQSRVAEEIALVYEWSGEQVQRVTAYLVLDAARVAAERLAEGLQE